MKSIKRTLALVLALVLALGVMGTAASARSLSDFPDANKFDASYRTAAEVMVGLGIIEGDENGLRPTDTITRAEACKIICFILLGSRAGELEGMEGNTNYIDVPSNEWYSMYVAYCTEKGIVSGDNGDGTGTFRPNDKITGYEFGKMCLCSIGYDSVYEGFESGIWQLEIKSLADRVGTSSNLTSSYSWGASITRQEAFQMAFDAMQKEVVVKRYDNTGKCNGYQAVTNPPILSSSFKTYTATGIIEYNPATKAFEIDGVKVEDVALENIGAQAKVFYQLSSNGTKVAITGTFLNLKVLAESTAGYTILQLIDKNQKNTFCGYERDNVITYNLNGVLVDGEAEGVFVPGIGDYVALCDSDGNNKVDFIFMQTYKVYQVTGNVTTSNNKVTVPGVPDLASGLDASKVVGTNNLSKGDYVMVYTFMEGERYELIKLVGARTMTLTKLGSNDPYQPYFSNVSYKYSSGCLFDVNSGNPPATSQLNTSFVVYLDSNGYIACITNVAGSTTPTETATVRYGILTAYQANGYKSATASGTFGSGAEEVKAVEQAVIYSFTSKSYVVYDFALSVRNGKTTFVAVNSSGNFLFGIYPGAGLATGAGASAAAYQESAQANNYIADLASGTGNKFYLVEYELDDSTGKITRIALVDTVATTVSLEKGKAVKLGDEYLSSSYKYFYIVRDSGDSSKFTINAYTGYTNAPTVRNASVNYSNSADVVVVETAATTPAPVDPSTVEVYIRSVSRYSTEKVGSKFVLSIPAYVNGVAVEIRVEDNDGRIDAEEILVGFYKATVTDNIYTLKEFIAPLNKVVTEKEETFFVYEGGTPIYFNSSTKFYAVSDSVVDGATQATFGLDQIPFSSFATKQYTILRVVTTKAGGDTAAEVYYKIG